MVRLSIEMNVQIFFTPAKIPFKRIKNKTFDFFLGLTLLLSCLFNSSAQGIQSLQSQLSAQGGGMGLNFDPGALGSAGIGILNSQNLGGINAGVISGSDPKATMGSVVSTPVFKPLGPNAFQNYVLETTGQSLRRWGAEFFDNSTNNNYLQSSPFVPLVNGPATPDYVLGSGDQLLVRAWGSVNINYQVTLDRNGSIAIPKVGTISLAGVKLSKAEGVIDQAISKYYKNFELNVTLGQIRTINVYVVGQARKPGSFALSSLSSLSSAIFATGGPNENGSMRTVQLKRNNKVLAEFDVYEFLLKGEVQNDVKLLDGDVIVYPALSAQVALMGSVNNPCIVEIKSSQESISDVLRLVGGLSLMADPTQVFVERMGSDQKSPRTLLPINLNTNSNDAALKNGDVIHVYPKKPELSGGVTLRGAVTQARKFAWKSGMRINDLIPSKADLVTKESIRRQNEALFDFNERERTLRSREQIPEDLLSDGLRSSTAAQGSQIKGALGSGQSSGTGFQAGVANSSNALVGPNGLNQAMAGESAQSLSSWQMQRDRRMVAQQPKIEEGKAKSLIEQVGQLLDVINLEYAVLERIDPKDLTVKVIPLNLGMAITNPD